MTQEERNQFADKWLERRVYDKTQLGALKHGIAEGRAEGRAEGILEIAKKMKAKGQPTDFIADITGLTIEEIEKL
jgi:predicted transposase/invertase (TIGR01784 family)